MSSGKTPFGRRQRGCPVGQINEDLERREFVFFNLLLVVGGLPLHFLVFPFGTIVHALIAGVFYGWGFATLKEKMELSAYNTCTIGLFHLFAGLCIYFVVVLTAFELNTFIGPVGSEKLFQFLQSALSFSSFADGMWHKIGDYKTNFGAHVERKYLFLVVAGLLYWPMATVVFIALCLRQRKDIAAPEQGAPGRRAGSAKELAPSIFPAIAICGLFVLLGTYGFYSEFSDVAYVKPGRRGMSVFLQTPAIYLDAKAIRGMVGLLMLVVGSGGAAFGLGLFVALRVKKTGATQ